MPDPYRDDDEQDFEDQKEQHNEFMRRRGQLQRMLEESGTFVTDQWAHQLWAFYQKLMDQGFDPQQSLQLVSIWFSSTLSPTLKLPK